MGFRGQKAFSVSSDEGFGGRIETLFANQCPCLPFEEDTQRCIVCDYIFFTLHFV